MTVITGVSGSGKTSLAFDTLYAEGQRRYIESLSTYTRQFLEKMPKPHIDRIENIPPAIALEQKNKLTSGRSTVGSQSELIDYLKLLYGHIGITMCPDCHIPVTKKDIPAIIRDIHDTKIAILSRLTTDIAMLQAQGFQRIYIEETKEILELGDTLPQGKTIYVVLDRLIMNEDPDTRTRLVDALTQGLSMGKGHVSILNLETKQLHHSSTKRICRCLRAFPDPDPMFFSTQSPLGACPLCKGFGSILLPDSQRIIPNTSLPICDAIDPLTKPSATKSRAGFIRFLAKNQIDPHQPYIALSTKDQTTIWTHITSIFEDMKRHSYKTHVRFFLRRYQKQETCSLCQGSRLCQAAQSIELGGLTLPSLLDKPLDAVMLWLKSLAPSSLMTSAIQSLQKRLELLIAIGVGYITLSRESRTLSGGEFQRITLATYLGSGLTGTLYVLDEPSIGLHARDTNRLIRLLHKLRDEGNTIVVIEHDLGIIQSADHIIELGPKAGIHGGFLVAEGSPSTLTNCLTADYLHKKRSISERPHKMPTQFLTLYGCQKHNLKNLTVKIPLGSLVALTGVSGSGKSSLLHDTLYPALSGQLATISGHESITQVHMLDQSGLSVSQRSNPATYMKLFDEIRTLFARTPQARAQKFTAGTFSCNTDNGRCQECAGIGTISLDMHFMAPIQTICETCHGKRFQPAVLAIKYRNKNIHDVLSMTIEEAATFFLDSKIAPSLKLLIQVGLGYLTLGQPTSTLSGGEAQRLKIASTLSQKTGTSMYLLDEPSTGLHSHDIQNLMHVFSMLLDQGHSVCLIEHHLDIIRQADWIIELGPEGGEQGGLIMAEGPLSAILASQSATALALA